MGRTDFHIYLKAEIKAQIQRSHILEILQILDTGKTSLSDPDTDKIHECDKTILLEALKEIDDIEEHFNHQRLETLKWFEFNFQNQNTMENFKVWYNGISDLLRKPISFSKNPSDETEHLTKVLGNEQKWLRGEIKKDFNVNYTLLKDAIESKGKKGIENIPEIALIEKLSSLSGLIEQFRFWVSLLKEFAEFNILQLNEDEFTVEVYKVTWGAPEDHPIIDNKTIQTLQFKEDLTTLLNDYVQKRDLVQLESNLRDFGAGLEKINDILKLLDEYEKRLEYRHHQKHTLNTFLGLSHNFLIHLVSEHIYSFKKFLMGQSGEPVGKQNLKYDNSN